MKILFVTDLHGSRRKYGQLLALSKHHGVSALVNGGDMLPKDGDLFEQDRFITGYLNRMDSDDYVFQQQFGSGVLSEKGKWKEIDNWFSYAKTLPTIEDEMENLVRPKDMAKAVYVIHMPPARLGLDKCSNGAEVGSRVIYRFIEKNQPLLTLHGHIHESPRMTGRWAAEVGRTGTL